MQDIFITKIHIDKVRHLKNVDIVLSDTERKHLILTGKNGSGKTSLLEAMRNIVSFNQTIQLIPTVPGKSVEIVYSCPNINYHNFVFAFIPAGRSTHTLPKAIEVLEIKDKTNVTRNVSTDFLRYILHLDYQLYGAITDNNKTLESNLEKWFDNFRSALREIYDCESLKLLRDTKNLTFKIDMPGREPFGLHEMAAGYAAFLDIYMELLYKAISKCTVYHCDTLPSRDGIFRECGRI